MTKPSHTYRIDLTPLDKFFFGGEDYFGAGEGVFYFQSSRAFPQQTSLLGLVRYQLLLQYGFLEQTASGKKLPASKKEAAAKLIGPESFDPTKATNDFGVIHSLSPVVMRNKDGEEWWPFWRAGQKDKHTFASLPARDLAVQFTPGKIALEVGAREVEHGRDIPSMPGYSGKNGLRKDFQHMPSGKTVTHGEIFDEKVSKNPQIGIYKNYRDKEDKEGFYKMAYQGLQAGWHFSFYLHTTQKLELKDKLVFFGKERSAFNMQISEDKNAFTHNPGLQGGETICLTADALLPPSFRDACRLIISGTTSFKNLHFKVKETENYAADPNKDKRPRYNLLEKGSLLLLKANQDSAKALQEAFSQDNGSGFQQIGYNHYRTIKMKINE